MQQNDFKFEVYSELIEILKLYASWKTFDVYQFIEATVSFLISLCSQFFSFIERNESGELKIGKKEVEELNKLYYSHPCLEVTVMLQLLNLHELLTNKEKKIHE